MKVLVTYASRLGGTQGIADQIRHELNTHGIVADARPIELVDSLAGYDAVVIGGSLYMGRWPRFGRRFVRRHAAELRQRPVWLFSSGPLDDSAETKVIPPTKPVAALMERIGARGHVTFGGRLSPDAHGFPAATMAKNHAGDWRDGDHIRAWTAELIKTLTTQPSVAT
jgi:menaquinone-dependent protoporphyrinogen oxidase